MSEEITTFELAKQFEEKRNADLFEQQNETNAVATIESKDKLIKDVFEQAVMHEVATNDQLKDKVLDTAQKYTETKMQTIATNVDTEYKEAVYNNAKDACESYGFNEKTTPIWAVNFMRVGYSIILAIWLFIGSFTFMPVIFIAKKMSVGLKKTWIAVVFAILLYAAVTILPIVLALLKSL